MTIYPQDLRAGVDVYSSDGEKLGELHRVVIARSDLRATHIVVDIGFLRSGTPIWLGGFGLEYDRVAPIEVVEAADDERVTLNVTAETFMKLPEYTAETYEEPQDLSPNEYDLPDVVGQMQRLSAILNNTPGLWLYENPHRAPGSVDISEGTPVWRQAPHEKIGDVKHLLLDETTGELKGLVISRGFLFHREVVLPARHIVELLDDIVRVDIADKDLDSLKAYE